MPFFLFMVFAGLPGDNLAVQPACDCTATIGTFRKILMISIVKVHQALPQLSDSVHSQYQLKHESKLYEEMLAYEMNTTSLADDFSAIEAGLENK